MNEVEKPGPWDLYWHEDNVDSCVASASMRDAEAIAELWRHFAADQAEGASVLDLATGNGTVPLALLQGNETLQITGVDKADIDPMKYLSIPGVLAEVNFVGGIDVCSLPFEAGTFDVLTSQFGIEYAPLDEAIGSVAAVLKRGGRLRFLMHHAESEIVVPAQQKIREMESLLQSGGVLDCLCEHVRDETPTDKLETAGQQHLDSGAGRSSLISGQIFEGVKRVMQSMQQGDSTAAGELAVVMVTRLQADRDRLMQLTAAALTEQQAQRVCGQLAEADIVVEQQRPLVIHDNSDDRALIGWQIDGHKR